MKRVFAAMAVFALLIPCLSWGEVLQRVKVGDVRPYFTESRHPYGSGSPERPAIWTNVVSSPGAQFVRVHFSVFDLSEGDYVTVSNPDGSQFWTYSLKGPQGNKEFWSFAVDGDTAILKLHAGPGSRGFGYVVDQVGHGAMKFNDQIAPEVICSSDGREDIACHTNDAGINAAQKTVARLLFTSGGSQYLCTGWLVRGSNSNTMLTNNHCFSSQRVVNTVQAKFNYQKTTCGGSTNATTTDYAGATFLKTNSSQKKGSKGGLDYTLFTLQGNPEATWGEIIPTTRAAVVGETIWFIQHPGGNPKRIGYYEDSNKATLCDVDTVNQTYGTAASGSQTGYACDSEGGSSGSPILAAGNGKAIALHHYGGVTSNPCLNSGTQMSRVCSDAGSLLVCDNN